MADAITTQYLETLLWSETLMGEITVPESSGLVTAGDTFEEGTPLDRIIDVSDVRDLAPDVWKEAESDCEAFAAYVEDELGFDPFMVFDSMQVAHDFALSRNGHGAGFFDGDYTHEGEQYANALQRCAKTFGTCGLDLYVSDAGELALSSHG